MSERDGANSSHDSTWSRVERIVDRFEEAWRRGLRPAIDDYLADAGPLRPTLLVELIRADMELRTRAGDAVRSQEYLERYPELVLQPEAVATLAHWELQLRRSSGLESPPLADTLPMARREETPQGTAGSLPCIPGYEVLQLIGRGAMGVVYKAHQTALRRVVALKMVLGEPFADSEVRQRFLAEAHTMAQTPHANIVHIHEIGEFKGQPYLVLEYVENGTLAQRMKRQPLTVQEAAVLTASLARAIHAAHCVGIIHRDLKPDNILLAADGTPKISDFGLARYLDEAVTRTQSGVILGTPAYMAPEQAAGGTLPVGAGADVYALGAVLFELLTGRVPFPGGNRRSVLWKVLHEEPTPPRRLRPGLPRDLQTICLKCLEKSPQRRYYSGLELAEDLERFLAGRPLRARPGPAWERALKWARRRPAFAALLMVTLLASLMVLGTWVGMTLHLQSALKEREEDLQTLAEAHRQELLQDLRRQQYATDLHQAAQLWQLGEATRCSDFLAARQPAAGEDDLCGFEWGYLRHWSHCPPLALQGQSVDGRWVRYHPGGTMLAACTDNHTIGLWDAEKRTLCGQLSGHTQDITAFAFSPDGRSLASASIDGTLRLWDVADRRQRAILVRTRGSFRAVEFSPDGGLLAFARDWDEVCLWDLHAGRLRHSWGCPEDTGFNTLAFAPDGQALAASYGAGMVRLWNVHSGEETRSWLFEQAPCALAFAPSGPLLAVGLQNGSVILCDVGTGMQLPPLTGHTRSIRCLAFSANGQAILSGGDDGTLRLWDLGSRRPCAILRGPTSRLALHPGGKAVAVGSGLGPVWIWDLQGLPAAPSDRLASEVVPAGPVAFSPDGKLLAVAGMDGAVHLLDSESTRVQRSLHGWYGEWQYLAFSPDGRHLAAAGQDHRVHVWDVRTGVRTATLLGHEDVVSCLAYSPDGRWLASGGRDHRIEVWAMPGGQSRHTLREPGGAITGLSFHPGGRLLAATSLDQKLRVWDVPGYTLRHCVCHSEELYGGQFSPNGRLLLATSKTGGPICWDVAGGREPGRAKEFSTGPCRSLTVFPDSCSLAISTARGVLIYDIASRTQRYAINRPGSGCRLAIAPGGRQMAVSERGGALAVWDVAGTPNRLVPDALKARQVHEGPSTPPPPIHSLLFTPDGSSLITASKEKGDTSFRTWGGLLAAAHDQRPVRRIGDQVRCWPLRGERLRRVLPGGATLSEHPLVSLSPDGWILAAAGSDGTVTLWGLGSGQLLRRLRVSRHSRTYFGVIEEALRLGIALTPQWDRDAISALSFSADGRYLAAACQDGQITLWEASSGEEIAVLPGDHAGTRSLAFSSDGRLLASDLGKTIELWDTSCLPQPPVLRRALAGHSHEVRCLSFAPGNQLLASGAGDGEIRLWDVESRGQVKVLHGHIGAATALSFSPDGKTLASGSWDGTVRLWQVASGQQLMTLTGEAQLIHAVTFSADGHSLAAGGESASGRGEVWLWQQETPFVASR